jgi:hypothetical protein
MATFRVGVGSFNINDGSVGIGTEGSGHGNLKVEGTLKASTNLDVLGVSTFTRYSGFSADEVNINNRDLTLSGEYSTTGDIVVEDGSSLTVGLGSTACVGTVECISVKNHFSVPVGDTAQRNETSGYAEGTVRYNTDLGTMEFFNGSEWRQFRYQADVQNSPSSRGRAVFSANFTDMICDFVNITSLGNARAFGGLSNPRATTFGCASETRGLWGGGATPSGQDVIDYITIASEGDAIDFGNLTEARKEPCSVSNSTRGMWCGGYNPSPARTNTIQYVEIATLGNALDFGDITSIQVSQGAAASPTRAIFSGGYTAPHQYDMVTIASKGNAVRFGDMAAVRARHDGCSNGTRGVFGGGRSGGGFQIEGRLEYITIASEGNGIEFGNLSKIDRNMLASASNKTRGLFAGGYDPNTSPTNSNVIDFITFSSLGDALDFGDLIEEKRGCSGLSDSHGGLGGY